ncbi:TlpA family protein disulfide reductase [Maribacter litoralis]|uniref:TlpA family protein disulfide reductase n=1 Tax=Maribacter litoralis TaxID=2059726 RepID=UPI003F5CE306
MKFYSIIIFYLLTTAVCNCQENKRILGQLINYDSIKLDTVFFTNGFLDIKYYNQPNKKGVVENLKFQLRNNFDYPQLYYVSLESEKNRVLFRGQQFYFDSLTKSVIIDTIGGNSKIIGPSQNEYETKFTNFFLKNSAQNGFESLEKYRFLRGEEFDQELNEYVKKNPNSFVALWNLIDRYNSNGHLKIYEEILHNFSEELSQHVLWKRINQSVKNDRIKEGGIFPNYTFKNQKLKPESLKLPKSKYILIDFWFSSCKPCIETFPKLKRLQKKYGEKRFEIVSISIDRTQNVEKWQNSITKLKLNWKHYLDENGVEARKDRINKFPTTFLLENNGNIIYKNITIDKLEIYLNKKFGF